jgi:hypothetical protein
MNTWGNDGNVGASTRRSDIGVDCRQGRGFRAIRGSYSGRWSFVVLRRALVEYDVSAVEEGA